MCKHIFQTLHSVVGGIEPDLAVLDAPVFSCKASFMATQKLRKVCLQTSQHGGISVLHQLTAGSAPLSHTQGLSFLLCETAGRRVLPVAQLWGRPNFRVSWQPGLCRAGQACGRGAAHTRHARLPVCPSCGLLWVQQAPYPSRPRGPRDPGTASLRGNTRPGHPPLVRGLSWARIQKPRPSHRLTPSALLRTHSLG